MSEERHDNDLTARDEAALARLLRLGGARRAVPDDVQARVYQQVRRAWDEANPGRGEDRLYATVRREWQRDTRKRQGGAGRRLFPYAIAASVLVAIGVSMLPSSDPAPTAQSAGMVVRSIGNTLEAGTELRVGDQVRTGAGEQLSIRLADAESLRLDEQSRLSIVARNHFELEAGRVYADTGDRIYRDRGLVVETPFGIVRDIGTQFSVTATAGGYEVAVREGRVDLERAGGTVIAVAGERLQVADDGTTSIVGLAPQDPYWGWATALAPSFDIENKSLLDFLRWAARESGRELVFEDPELRLAAMRTDLHGSVVDFDPIDAVASVLATTNFHHRIEAERIVIER